MPRWRQFNFSPTQRRLIGQLLISNLLVGLVLLTVFVLLWPARVGLSPLWLLLMLLLAPVVGLGLSRNLLRDAAILDVRLADLRVAAPTPSDAQSGADRGAATVGGADGSTAPAEQQLMDRLNWVQTASAMLDRAAHTDRKLMNAAVADQRSYQQVRQQLRSAQADLAVLVADGRATPAAMAALRERLRILESDLQRWQQSTGGNQTDGGDDQLARWRAGQQLQSAAPAGPPDWQTQFDLDQAKRAITGASRALTIKATLLFLWMFFIQTASSSEVIVATILMVVLSAVLLRLTSRATANLPLPAVAGSQPAQQLRLQVHWRRATSGLLDAFWLSVLLLTWSRNGGAPLAAALWLIAGLVWATWEGWQAVQVMDRAARPLPASDQQAFLQAARRQSQSLRITTVALLVIGWLCYNQALLAYPRVTAPPGWSR